MPRVIRWKGRNIRRPGTYTWHNLSGLANLNLGVEQSIIIIGEADAGEPQATAQTPVYHAFTDATAMIDTFQSGHLAEVARIAFNPVAEGQQEYGVPIAGASKVYVIKTNATTQASYTLQDAAAHNAVTLKDLLWGPLGNQTWFKLEVSGSGLQLTVGRDSAPNIGEHVGSKLFSITGTDEWFSMTYTGADLAATMAFDGTTFSTTTTAGGTADISITVGDKTLTEIVDLINAVDATYSAVVLRPNDRANTPFKYIDRFSGVNIKALVAKQMGVAYDIVEWVNANSPYVEATWVNGYEPKPYAQTALAGGAIGDSTGTTIEAAYRTARKLPSRHIVSAFPDDTGAGGAVTLDVVNGYLVDHLNKCNPVGPLGGFGGSAERQGYCCSNSATKAALITELAGYNSAALAITNNEIYRQGEGNAKKWIGTHGVAVAVASMKAGSPVGTPATWKYLKANDVRFLAADFDVTDDDDFGIGIDGGLLMVESADGGFRIAEGISTYKTEDNDLLILLEGVGELLWTSILLRRRFGRSDIGQKGRGTPDANDARGGAIEVFLEMSNQGSPDFCLVDGTDPDTGEPVPPFDNVTATLAGDSVTVRADLVYTLGKNFYFFELNGSYPYALSS